MSQDEFSELMVGIGWVGIIITFIIIVIWS
jgi:hypothetical protein